MTQRPMISNNIAKNKKWLPELNTPLPKNPIKLINQEINELMQLWNINKFSYCKAYQKKVMPFLELIVYPPKRNKIHIEQAIFIGKILGS